MIVLRGARWAPSGNAVLDGLDLELHDGEVTAILGASGCGKSSLLRIVAGLRTLDGGVVTGVPAQKAFVFQDAALLPWRTLRDNVALPMELAGARDEARVDDALAQVGLTAQADALPRALSGGQRMRGNLARALVADAQLVLLDEAFGSLDAVTRRIVQEAFAAIRARHGWTVLLVTHDPEDAIRLADRVLLVDGPPLRVREDLRVADGLGADELLARIRALVGAEP